LRKTRKEEIGRSPFAKPIKLTKKLRGNRKAPKEITGLIHAKKTAPRLKLKEENSITTKNQVSWRGRRKTRIQKRVFAMDETAAEGLFLKATIRN